MVVTAIRGRIIDINVDINVDIDIDVDINVDINIGAERIRYWQEPTEGKVVVSSCPFSTTLSSSALTLQKHCNVIANDIMVLLPERQILNWVARLFYFIILCNIALHRCIAKSARARQILNPIVRIQKTAVRH